MNRLFGLVARFVFGRMLPRVAYPVARGPLQGSWFVLGSMGGEAGGVSVYFNMIETEQTAALVATLGKGQVFFDVGANVGYYTILGSRLVGDKGTVIAFEPVVRNLVYLFQHTILNRVGNVKIIPAACSDITSLAIFSAGENFAMGYLGENKDNRDMFPVPTVSIDETIQRVGISPDVMKIDVEGGELSVLKGAKEVLCKAHPKIFLSTHSDILRQTCLEYLSEHGYSYEVLSKNKENPSTFLAI